MFVATDGLNNDELIINYFSMYVLPKDETGGGELDINSILQYLIIKYATRICILDN